MQFVMILVNLKNKIQVQIKNMEKKSKKDEGGGEYRILKMEKFLIKLV